MFLILPTLAFALDREAFTFTNYNLQVRIDPAKPPLAASGSIRLRNDSTAPQRVAALQISSTIDWKSVLLEGKPVQYLTHSITSDIDHTGELSEVVVTLPRDVAPKASIELQVAYEGTVPQDATRLERIGTPKAIAAANDWDRVSESVIALRGVGYVVWYPVALEAASLADANQFSEMLGRWKERHAGSVFSARISIAGSPTLISNGECAQAAADKTDASVVVNNCQWKSLGADQPVLVAGDYGVVERPAVRVYHFPGSQAAAADYARVAMGAAPLVREWLGELRRSVTIVELPGEAAPFEAGTLYVTPLRVVNTRTLEVFLTHQLAHAALSSPRMWISEGVANFMQAVQRERQAGRSAAILHMQKQLPALIEVEKNNLKAVKTTASGEAPSSAATSLVATTDTFLTSSKGMYVWWMLRDMLGDRALQNALQKYRGGEDRQPEYMQRLLEAEARTAAPQQTARLEQFFDDWVYRDRGLPDFRIASVFAREMLGSGYLLTVTVENLGGAGTEVPVIARAKDESPSRRLRAPARQKATVRVPLRSPPVEAQVNDGSVPESNMTNNTINVKLEASAE
jgi:hypothetical protein